MTALTIIADEAEALASSTQHRVRELDEAISLAADPDALSDLKREQEQLKSVRAGHQRRRDNMKSVLANVRHWLERIPANAPIEQLQPVLAKIEDGESVKDAVDRCRAAIEGLRVELLMAKQAVPPKSELKLQASNYVTELLAKSKPSIRPTPDGLQIRFHSAAAGPLNSTDVISLIALMDGGVSLKRQLHAAIDQLSLPNAMTKAEKENAITRIRAELHRWEAQEEALICTGADSGVVIDRRADANPAAILGVKIGKPKGQPKPVEHPPALVEFMENNA